jgi:hypothetical protein
LVKTFQELTFDDFLHHPIIRTWLLRLIIPAVIFFSIFIGYSGNQTLLIRIAALLIGVVGLLLVLRQPALGLIGVLIGAFFVPFAGPGGFNLAVLGIAGLTGLWLFDAMIRERQITINHIATAVPLFTLIVISLISFLIGQLAWYPTAQQAPITAQVGGFVIFVLSACAFLLMANYIRDLRWLKIFTWLFVAIGAVYIIGRVVPQLGYRINPFFQSGATSNNSIFWVWLLCIPFSQMLLNTHLHKVWRAALGLLVVMVLYVAIVQAYDWKSGFMPPLAGVAAIIALLLRKKVVFFIPVLAVVAYFASIQAVGTEEYSTLTRVEAWLIVINLTMISPIFGLGFANYYFYTSLVPILGWYVSFNSHSQYVDIFAQTGIAGLVCFFWIFWRIGLLGWQLKDRTPAGFERAFVYGAIGGAVGTVAAGWFVDWVLPFVYNIGMNGFRGSMLSWLFMGGLVIIHQSIAKRENQQAINPDQSITN